MAVKDMHSKGTHSLIGAGAIVLGVALGIGVVYWDGTSNRQLTVEAQEAFCPGGDYKCDYNNPPPGKNNCKMNYPCKKVTNGFTCNGLCKDNKCDTLGCEGKGLEGKPKEMPKEMGGMPPMLPMLPMPMPKMPMPMEPKPADCEKHPTSTDCRSTSGSSGISGFLGNLFGTNSESGSTIGNAVQSTFQSVTDRLTSFLKGGTESSATVNANTGTATNNPTEAVVTPVTPSGSNAGQLTAQGTVQASSNGTTQGNGLSAPTVTGFEGGASADVNTSTGPIVTAIRDVIGKIRDLLSSWF